MFPTWSECLNQVHLYHTIEPHDQHGSFQVRPDIAVHSATDFIVELDVSIAHPWYPGVISTTALSSSSAIVKAEKKIEKYSMEKHSGSFAIRLVVFMFEHFGHCGSKGLNFCIRSLEGQGMKMGKSTPEFKTYWRQLFLLHYNCNSSRIRRKDTVDRPVCTCTNDCFQQLYSSQYIVSINYPCSCD